LFEINRLTFQIIQINYSSVDGKYHGALGIVKNFLVVYTPRWFRDVFSSSEEAGDF
jgi:hypothetical protein